MASAAADLQASVNRRGDAPAVTVLGVSIATWFLAVYGGPDSGSAGSLHWVLVVPLALGLAAWPATSWRLAGAPGFLPLLLLALPFAALSRAWEVPSRGSFDSTTFFYLSLYLQARGLLRLYGPRDDERLSQILVFSTVPMALAGADTPMTPYIVLTVLFGAACLFLLRATIRQRSLSPAPARRARRAVWIASSAAVALSVGMALFVHFYYDRINSVFMQIAYVSGYSNAQGFSRTSRLGDIQAVQDQDLAQEIALRAFGPEEPGYLRGRVYYTYAGGAWATVFGRERSVTRSPEAQTQYNRFPLPGRDSRVLPSPFEQAPMTIYPARRYRAHLFLPLSATALDTPARRLLVHAGNGIETVDAPSSQGYGIFRDENAPVFDPPEDDEYKVPATERNALQTPPGLTMQARLAEVVERALVESDCAKDAPAAERVAALRNYFARHYTYRFGITFRNPSSPVWEWLDLNQHREGHCELFASAGVLLLRHMKIPARYVTGFVCDEKNPYGEVWVARNAHAHAWIEYLDGERGWITAEFTPPDGMPAARRPQGWWQPLKEWIDAEVDRLTAFLAREGLGGLLDLLLGELGAAGNWVIESRVRSGIAMGLLALFLYHRFFRRRARRRRLWQGEREFPAELALQREAYLRLEKRLRRSGFGRRPEETPLEYAVRLAQADPERLPDRDRLVEQIRTFAAARYARF